MADAIIHCPHCRRPVRIVLSAERLGDRQDQLRQAIIQYLGGRKMVPQSVVTSRMWRYGGSGLIGQKLEEMAMEGVIEARINERGTLCYQLPKGVGPDAPKEHE